MYELSEIARRIGGEVVGGRVSAPGPGHGKRDRSLRVWIEQGRLCVTSFANDDWPTCMDHVRAMLGLAPFDPSKPRRPQQPTYQAHHNPEIDKASAAQKASRAARLWHTSHPVQDTLAERYLAGRHLPLPDDCDRVLRFHPAAPREAERQPALIARFTPICGDDSAPVSAVLRIFLKPDGSGHDGKWTLGSPFADEEKPRSLCQCIKLSPDAEVSEGLHLAEGVETSLACLAFGLAPIWACFTAGGLAAFPLLHGITCLTAMADNDASDTGQAAAIEVANRYQKAGVEARVILAEGTGRDWADRWIEYRSKGT